MPNHGQLSIILSASSGDISPFDERTKEFSRNNAVIESILIQLKDADFKNLDQEIITCDFSPGTIKAEDWIYIVENRLWTAFFKENIDDNQMRDLISHIKQ